MKYYRTIVVIVAGAVLFALLYPQAQTFIFNLNLISQESLRALATDPPIGGETTALMLLGVIFFLEVFLAALLAALPAGAVVEYFAPTRPVIHAGASAAVAAAWLFATALFLVMRPRYIPGWIVFPAMVGLLAISMAWWVYLTTRLTSRSSSLQP